MTSSTIIKQCQICNFEKLEPILFLGYSPPPSQMHVIGESPSEQPSYPLRLLYCPQCHLVQLGLAVSAQVLFPPNFPYTSSTTKALRDNFSELYKECATLVHLESKDLIVDIGSNDGNLLSYFTKHQVLGVTPEDMGQVAIQRGIPTIIDFFTKETAQKIKSQKGLATLVTATNVFAHVENIHEMIKNILEILSPKGISVSESHYLVPFLEKLQYDTIYHEHLRYYSLHSLKYLLEMHGLEIIYAKQISTHGGSLRVYAARKNTYPTQTTVAELLKKEQSTILNKNNLIDFRNKVIQSKLALHHMLFNIFKEKKQIYGIGAAARGTTLINYVGLDDGILTCIVETQGSHKIGKYIPGTLIPVFEESKLFTDQPEYALLLSWHLAADLIPKIKAKGFKGRFIIPLPIPTILS